MSEKTGQSPFLICNLLALFFFFPFILQHVEKNEAVRLFLLKKSNVYRPLHVVKYAVVFAAILFKFLCPSKPFEEKVAAMKQHRFIFDSADSSALQVSLAASYFGRTSLYRSKMFPSCSKDQDEMSELSSSDGNASACAGGNSSNDSVFKLLFLSNKTTILDTFGDDFPLTLDILEKLQVYMGSHPMDMHAIMSAISDLSLGLVGKFKVYVTADDLPTISSFHRINGNGVFRRHFSNKLTSALTM